MKAEGPGGFYKGLSAGLMRQVFYTGARLGLFLELRSVFAAGEAYFSLLFVTCCVFFVFQGDLPRFRKV